MLKLSCFRTAGNLFIYLFLFGYEERKIDDFGEKKKKYIFIVCVRLNNRYPEVARFTSQKICLKKCVLLSHSVSLLFADFLFQFSVACTIAIINQLHNCSL